jgi:hypothetical protein
MVSLSSAPSTRRATLVSRRWRRRAIPPIAPGPRSRRSTPEARHCRCWPAPCQGGVPRRFEGELACLPPSEQASSTRCSRLALRRASRSSPPSGRARLLRTGDSGDSIPSPIRPVPVVLAKGEWRDRRSGIARDGHASRVKERAIGARIRHRHAPLGCGPRTVRRAGQEGCPAGGAEPHADTPQPHRSARRPSVILSH